MLRLSLWSGFMDTEVPGWGTPSLKPQVQKKQSGDPATGSRVSLIPVNESVRHCNFDELGNGHKMFLSLSVVMQWGNKGTEMLVGVLGTWAVIHLPLGYWKRDIQGSGCWSKSSPMEGHCPELLWDGRNPLWQGWLLRMCESQLNCPSPQTGGFCPSPAPCMGNTGWFFL